MSARIYKFPGNKSRARERDELAAAIRAIAPAMNTLAEEAVRRQTILTCQIIERHERRKRQTRRNEARRRKTSRLEPI
jgi:hypothetical protein